MLNWVEHEKSFITSGPGDNSRTLASGSSPARADKPWNNYFIPHHNYFHYKRSQIIMIKLLWYQWY